MLRATHKSDFGDGLLYCAFDIVHSIPKCIHNKKLYIKIKYLILYPYITGVLLAYPSNIVREYIQYKFVPLIQIIM